MQPPTPRNAQPSADACADASADASADPGLRAAAASHGSQPALIYEDVTLSYRDLSRRAAAVWAALRRRGVTPGQLVAVQATNRIETLLTILSLIEAGVPFVPLHPRLTAAEAAPLIADAQPAHVLYEADILALAAAETMPTAEDSEAWAALPSADADPSVPLAILYTSGTSGMPKGAVLSRAAFWHSARASAQNLGFLPRDRWLLCLPLCHVGGLSIVTRCLQARSTVLLLPRFSAAAVLTAIQTRDATLLSVVPTMLAALLDADAADPARRVLPRLRAVLSGGADTPLALRQRSLDHGVQVLATYGLTEACSQVTVQTWQPAPPLPAVQAGCGLPLPGVQLAILPSGTDDTGTGDASAAVRADARALPAGVVGQICVRGPTVMTGYLRRKPLADGWFDTGDLGYVDDQGVLHVLSRRTDLIVRGGENVYPAEVEAALLTCSGVAAALVFGVDDPVWGAKVAAALVPLPDDPRALDDPSRFVLLAEQLAPRLAGFKRPRRVCFVRALPELANGKPDRRRAARDLADQLRPLPSSGLSA